MYNYGYRDYKTQLARFTTVDPIRDGTNWLVYCNGDAVNFVDPDGRNKINLAISVAKVDPDKMDRLDTRDWIFDKIVGNESIPVCQALYRLGLSGQTADYDFSENKVITEALSKANNHANNTIKEQVQNGKICPESSELGSTSFDRFMDKDLYGAFGGGNAFTWNVVSVNEKKKTVNVEVYLEDVFDFNEGNGQRDTIGEKLTKIGRKAELSSFKVYGTYDYTVRVDEKTLKKIQEELKND